ncbi:MAG: phenylalanine--tRNA ligase subunit beta, partial [Pseudomonadales bacterium]|nr:phenylalanine--tRNA ligase subunit beta [Pseudomonadales bacterium]
MKFSESWLREFVSPALTTQQLVDQLTMAGLEVDGFEPVASECSKVVVGEILSVALHPDADKLVVCKVDAGDQTHQVVCGAPNAKQGVKIPFALVGAKLDDFKIKKAKLRGVESFGMLCSERELGISDKHEGLMELPVDAPVGTDIREYLQLNDAIVDLDLTPNRSDCLGMVGLARETGLVNSLDVKQVSATVIEATINDVFAVELEASTACPRFVGRVIRGINLKAETPLWMREKLRRSEIRSIDPIVDVTNFVMLELGQPLHAYDLATLSGKIQVRQSKEGERLTLLDGSEISLVEDTLLIADASGPIGMAGIMGGHTTSVTDSTVDIFLESAFFLPTAIAGRARSYGLNTDASHRFERGVDWQGQRRAIERATDLVLQICGGQAAAVVETVIETELPHTALVELRLQRVNKMLGVEIKASQVEDMLTRLGFEFCQLEISADGRDEDPVWQVSSPSHRFDISIEADLIEEISRVYGYNNLPVKTPKTNLTMAPIEEGLLSTNQLKDQLVARGYQEAITYSFVDPVVQAVLDPTNDPIELANPLSSEMAVMRTTLWAGLIRALQHNINRQQSRVRLFETGLSFQQSNSASELLMQNIRQEPMLAGVLCGSRNVESWGNSTDLVD